MTFKRLQAESICIETQCEKKDILIFISDFSGIVLGRIRSNARIMILHICITT